MTVTLHWRSKILTLAAAVTFLVAPIAVRAQASDGATMSLAVTHDMSMITNNMAEARCERGQPVATQQWGAAHAKIEALMQDFAFAAARSDQEALRKLFSHPSDGGFMGPSGKEPVGAINDPWATPPGAEPSQIKPMVLTQERLIVAFDVRSARGFWKAVRPNPVDPNSLQEIDYVADFNANQFGSGSWRIWRIRVFLPPDAPTPAQLYCHRSQIKPLW
ncbi:MAG: hypothetical protein ACHP7N_16895 [Caulobacterales bacterium]